MGKGGIRALEPDLNRRIRGKDKRMKVLIRGRYKEHLRPRAHIWIEGDTLCKKISSKVIKREKYMVIDYDNELRLCQTCASVKKKLEG